MANPQLCTSVLSARGLAAAAPFPVIEFFNSCQRRAGFVVQIHGRSNLRPRIYSHSCSCIYFDLTCNWIFNFMSEWWWNPSTGAIEWKRFQQRWTTLILLLLLFHYRFVLHRGGFKSQLNTSLLVSSFHYKHTLPKWRIKILQTVLVKAVLSNIYAFEKVSEKNVWNSTKIRFASKLDELFRLKGLNEKIITKWRCETSFQKSRPNIRNCGIWRNFFYRFRWN